MRLPAGPALLLRRPWAVARRTGGAAAIAGVLLAHAAGAAAASKAPRVTVVNRAGVYEVRGTFATRAPLPTAWAVLTDYGRISAFVSSMRSSELLSRNGDSVRVRQVAAVTVFPVRRSVHVTLAVLERPHDRIDFVDVSGEDFRTYVGAWSLHVESESTVVAYTLDAAPRASAPGWLSRNVMSHTTVDLLSQVRAEIDRRAAKR